MLPMVARYEEASTLLGGAEGILAMLHGDRVAVMLFGSHARGDARADSDIDVLQLVERWSPSYSIGRLSVSVYTCAHLSELALGGSLFVLHLIAEGSTVEDPAGRLARILASYRPPNSYQKVRENLRRASSVLDVEPSIFQRNPAGFLRVAFYLLRTALYVRCAESGPPVFAMRGVANTLGQPQIIDIFDRRRCATFDCFQEVRAYVYREVGADGVNEYGSLEALSVALHVTCPIASHLALKLLAGSERIDYDSSFLDWSHHG